MLSSTTNVIVCDVDLNLDGQEFAALRSEQRDPSRPVHGDAQRPTQRRSARHRPAASSTATRSTCCSNARRGPPWRAQRTARARRTARGPHARSAHAARLLERSATRSAHAMCVMVGVHLAASTRTRHAGGRHAGQVVEHMRQGRPRPPALGIERRIAIAVAIADPAERAAVAHRHRHAQTARRHQQDPVSHAPAIAAAVRP